MNIKNIMKRKAVMKDRIYIYQTMAEAQAQLQEAEEKREKIDNLILNISTAAAYIALAVSAIGFPMFLAAMM